MAERKSPAATPGSSSRIAEGITAWLAPGAGWGQSNAALICGQGSSLLVDTLWDLEHTEAMLDGLGPAIAAAPIEQVVNTHSDGDHWHGNQLAGARQIIASKSAARSMKRHGRGEIRALGSVAGLCRFLGAMPIPGRAEWRAASFYLEDMVRPFDFSGIRPVLPNLTFSGKLKLDVGGREVLLIEVGPAHTLGDVVVHVPDARAVMAGDILFLGSTPVLWDGSARNWIHACERILQLKPEVVVPGHGPLTDMAGVDLVRHYWQFLRSAVRRHFERGRPALDAALRIVRSDEFLKQPFAGWGWRERTVINVEAIYRRLAGRSRRIGRLDRLRLMRQTAVMYEELARQAPAIRSEPAPEAPAS